MLPVHWPESVVQTINHSLSRLPDTAVAEMGLAAVSQPHLHRRPLGHQVQTCRTWTKRAEPNHNNQKLQHQFNRICLALIATLSVAVVAAEITRLMIRTSPPLGAGQSTTLANRESISARETSIGACLC